MCALILISRRENLRILYAFDLHCNATKKICEALTVFTAFLSSTKSLRIGLRARELYAGLVRYVSAWRPRVIVTHLFQHHEKYANRTCVLGSVSF